MALNLYEQINPDVITTIWYDEYYNRLDYFYQAYLPGARTDTLELEYLVGKDDLPVTLEPSALDTKMIIRDRRSFNTAKVEIPFFRESMILNELDALTIYRYLQHSNIPGGRSALTRLLNDSARLVESSRVNKEIMFCGLITNAAFTINGRTQTSNEGIDWDWNYDPNGTWAASNKIDVTTANAGVDFADPDFDILGYFQDFRNDLETRGQSVSVAIIGNDTATDLYNNNYIKALIDNRVQVDLNYVRYDRRRVLDALEDWTGIRFVIHRKAYGDKNSLALGGPVTGDEGRPTGQFFYPQRGTISLLPDGPIGNMYHGMTPEELYAGDGISIVNDAQSVGFDEAITLVDGGIAVCTKSKSAPCQLTTWVSGMFAPSYERIDDVYVMTYNSYETP